MIKVNAYCNFYGVKVRAGGISVGFLLERLPKEPRIDIEFLESGSDLAFNLKHLFGILKHFQSEKGNQRVQLNVYVAEGNTRLRQFIDKVPKVVSKASQEKNQIEMIKAQYSSKAVNYQVMVEITTLLLQTPDLTLNAIIVPQGQKEPNFNMLFNKVRRHYEDRLVAEKKSKEELLQAL